MDVKLIKQTTKITGNVYYYVTVDGAMQSDTWTSDLEKAQESFQDILVKCIAFPEDRYETLKSETI
jgi:hypothetical protein